MEKASVLLGGAFGAIAVVAVFAVFVFPPAGVGVDSNVHGLPVSAMASAGSEQILTLEDLFVKSESGTVSVESKHGPDSLRGAFGIGSGFVYDSRGHIITNEHVVDDATEIVVTFLDGRSYKADIVGTDEYTDIAVLYVNADNDILTPLQLGDSSQINVGEPIAAIGNPFGLSGSMTAGIVSQLGRLLQAGDTAFQIPDVIQTDAVINPGNSGGPLLNMRGQVIGMNTAIQSNTGVFTGVGFAVPSQTIAKIVPYLVRDGHYRHPWIGITGTDIGLNLAVIANLPDTRGFLVIGVSEDSPAAKAGLQGSDRVRTVDGIKYSLGGDVIMSVDGKIVRSIDDILVHLQRSKSVGDEIVLEVLRDDQSIKITLILEQRPDN